MDCAKCVVPEYGSAEVCEPFCSKCRRQLLRKMFCVALHEDNHSLLPFITLDDANDAAEYAGRLRRQGVAHVILNWNTECGCFFRY